MKFVMFGVLALAAIGFAAALLVGAPQAVIAALAVFLAVVTIATFVLSRLRGTLNLELDQRLPRALLTSDRR